MEDHIFERRKKKDKNALRFLQFPLDEVEKIVGKPRPLPDKETGDKPWLEADKTMWEKADDETGDGETGDGETGDVETADGKTVDGKSTVLDLLERAKKGEKVRMNSETYDQIYRQSTAKPQMKFLHTSQKKLPTVEARNFVLPFKRRVLANEPVRITVIGTANVGKSSLVNSLLEEERVVVDAEAGTTLDTIACKWQYKKQECVLVDTAPLVRRWKTRADDLGLRSGHQTMSTIRESQVVLLMLDATAKDISHFEYTLAKEVTDEARALIIVINKWDMIEEGLGKKLRKTFLENLKKISQVKDIPCVFVSAKYRYNLGTLMNRITMIYRRWNARVPTGKLNDWVRHFTLRWPPPWRHGTKCNVKYITQVKSRPPTFVLWTNILNQFPAAYLRQLQNSLREEFDLHGTTMRLMVRTTAMPTPGRKLCKSEVLKWKRMGPAQKRVVENLTQNYVVRQKNLASNA
eukprot:Platyproteum_vivax@DN7958_c0_g1_i1.p1